MTMKIIQHALLLLFTITTVLSCATGGSSRTVAFDPEGEHALIIGSFTVTQKGGSRDLLEQINIVRVLFQYTAGLSLFSPLELTAFPSGWLDGQWDFDAGDSKTFVFAKTTKPEPLAMVGMSYAKAGKTYDATYSFAREIDVHAGEILYVGEIQVEIVFDVDNTPMITAANIEVSNQLSRDLPKLSSVYKEIDLTTMQTRIFPDRPVRVKQFTMRMQLND